MRAFPLTPAAVSFKRVPLSKPHDFSHTLVSYFPVERKITLGIPPLKKASEHFMVVMEYSNEFCSG